MTRSANSDCTLVIMAKAPRPGMVKTRLGPSLAAGSITELYRCLLDDTLALAKSLDHIEVVMMCPAPDVEDLARSVGKAVAIVAQTGDGIAAGLSSVFEQFASTGHRRVIAFNSDSPHLPASTLQRAFEMLAASDLVVGPTYDGGYYLVGATASHPNLFLGDAMGTANALEALMAQARSLGLTVTVIEPFYDIDVLADLSRLADELLRAPERAPKTAEWLRTFRTRRMQSGEANDTALPGASARS